MLKKNFLICIAAIFFVFITNSNSLENKILVKIENQIITSLDIINEYKYLVSLNPSLKNIDKERIAKFSKKSIIQEKIKKIEIEKNFDNPKIPEKYLEQILKNIYSKIGLSSMNDFKKYLTNNDIDFENVKTKLETEALWNELIFIRFSSQLKINEKSLREKIDKNNKFLKSYLMSEISFEALNLKDLNDKFIEISSAINNEGFDFAALKYSTSPTSKFGGKVDWINENSLNKTIKAAIVDLEINDFTKPITVPGGFLILKINDIKKDEVQIDVEKELKRLINYEKNNQLNQYSQVYFNKIKKNLQIDEL
jgi:peptidyl-prolyl cis-trans isomerase SurA